MVWLNFILIVLVTFLLIAGARVTLRKVFNIEKVKRDFFSQNHFNNSHKIIDWVLRTISTIVLFISFYFIIFQNVSVNIFLSVLIVTSGTDYAVRAFFEWRYSKNPKQSIITVSDMVITVFVLLAIIQFDLLVT